MDGNGPSLSRGDFFRVSAVAAAGVCADPSRGPGGGLESAEARRGHVVTVTHGPGDSTRVMLALFTATRLPAGDNHVWFAIDGGQLCKKGAAEKVSSPLFEKQGNAAKLIAQLRERGVAIHI